MLPIPAAPSKTSQDTAPTPGSFRNPATQAGVPGYTPAKCNAASYPSQLENSEQIWMILDCTPSPLVSAFLIRTRINVYLPVGKNPANIWNPCFLKVFFCKKNPNIIVWIRHEVPIFLNYVSDLFCEKSLRGDFLMYFFNFKVIFMNFELFVRYRCSYFYEEIAVVRYFLWFILVLREFMWQNIDKDVHSDNWHSIRSQQKKQTDRYDAMVGKRCRRSKFSVSSSTRPRTPPTVLVS